MLFEKLNSSLKVRRKVIGIVPSSEIVFVKMKCTMTRLSTQVEEVVMLVKTYPTPSETYGELVCAAGIRLRDNAWVRIYPYPFRLMNEDKRFNKGSILQIPLSKASNDRRPESYKIANVNDIREIGHLSTKNNWAERMALIKPTVLSSVAELKASMFPDSSEENDRWGPSILPVRVESDSAHLSWEKNDGWNEKQLTKLQKAENFVKDNLFLDEGIKQSFRQLAKVPYEFRLSYKDSSGEEYNHLILDWEIPQLYFNVRQEAADDKEALEKVRYKIEESIFDKRNDVYLILGNIHHRFRNPDAIAIDGFVYPKRQLQGGLF